MTDLEYRIDEVPLIDTHEHLWGEATYTDAGPDILTEWELQRIVDGMTGKPKAHPSRFCTSFRGRSRILFRASGVAS